MSYVDAQLNAYLVEESLTSASQSNPFCNHNYFLNGLQSMQRQPAPISLRNLSQDPVSWSILYTLARLTCLPSDKHS